MLQEPSMSVYEVEFLKHPREEFKNAFWWTVLEKRLNYHSSLTLENITHYFVMGIDRILSVKNAGRPSSSLVH